MNEEVINILEKELKEKSGSLGLCDCGLESLPEELLNSDYGELLRGLTKLDLSFNYISDYHFFDKLPSLNSLSLEICELSDLSILDNLSGLTCLNLGYNRIIDISDLGKHRDLHELDLSGNDINKISSLSSLTRLTSLKLSGNNIKEISSLSGLTNLTSLDLSRNEIKDISYLSNLTGLISLDLSGNYIDDISSLSNLTDLTSLNISSNDISIISSLSSLTGLTSLILNGNKIEDYSSLSNLIGLTKLYLGGNEITNNSFLLNLKGLTDLSFSGNDANDYSCLAQLTGLNSLAIDVNGVDDISFLSSLKGLSSLYLHGNNISEYSHISNLTELTSLELSRNDITDISFLSDLKRLTNLDLAGNEISDISYLSNLKRLKNLYLRENKISDISHLSGLTNLSNLDLHTNYISDVSFLINLTELTTLDLADNEIMDVSCLSKLTELDNLDLSHNKIRELDHIIPLLQRGLSVNCQKYGGYGISLYKNPITSPPMNIVEQGRDAILEWFSQIDETGASPFYESKLMILGQGGAGKTTFTNLLLNPKYEVKPGKLDSTIGVVVNRGKEFVHAEDADINIQAHLWDFGGQNIQKMLHQFFITEECLYVLVSDKRAENTNFDYWFQIINLLGPKSNVIVLENPKEAKHANEKFALNKYQELYPGLTIDSIEVNLNQIQTKYKKRWASLQEMISVKLSKIELVNRKVPKKWGLVRNALKQREESRYIRKDEYYKLCEDPSIGFNKRQADWCLDYFRSVGDLVYFDDRDLCTHIFLDHNWLTKGMYYILSDKKIEERGGRFTRNQAFSKWDSNNYSEEEKVMLINLLLKDKFDICYELPDQKDVFITPLLLPADKPKNQWNHETHLRFRYHYGFIPHGLFSRLIVQLNDKIEKGKQWKT
jgi:Leucine-rich repeat (LRR) protein/GTPase SAR1 family protein